MSRADNVGMWWADFPVTERQATARAVRVVDPPKTGWLPPKDLPNLSGARILGFDTETFDPHLLDKGPGGVRKDGHIVGISLATEDRAWYFPLRHEYPAESHLNMDPAKVIPWVADLMAGKALKVGANILYDGEWLRSEGAPVAGPFYDIQFAEPLLDENLRSYAMETLAQRHLGIGKTTHQLYEWAAESFGGEAGPKQRANIYRSPPSLVGPYAESDAMLPLAIRKIQMPLLEAEHLTRLCDIEHRLIPLLLDMRFRGVRVDLDKAEQVLKWLRVEAKKAQDRLGKIDAWAQSDLKKAFEAAGLPITLTAAGNPSFTKEVLEAYDHPLAADVLAVRTYEKAANPFIESYILGNQINGRIHCQFHPLRNDEYGTVSGRFSSSNPNLQNIPARNKILAPLLRGIFIPEEGCQWRRADYSQVEYRLLAHDAIGRGADALRARYQKDPTVNFHRLTMELVEFHTGILMEYKASKNFNFGMVYGMGKDKIIRSLGVSPELGLQLNDAYHEASPFVKITYQGAQRLASRRGFIRTLLGRRRRYDQWETDEQTGHKRRAFTNTALNARLQGSAADIAKKALVDIYEAGIYDVVGPPHVIVHDETDGSDDQSPAAVEAYRAAKHIMETSIKLKVPLMVEESTGPNWGACA